MPYRRLPNTDNARIKSLRIAIEKKRSVFNIDVIQLDVHNLESMLRNFENAHVMYKNSLEKQVVENRKFQKLIKNARIYVSHFIQVLNLCVIRREIKKEGKVLYGLDIENAAVPDLSNNDSLVSWGENIIKGENVRIQKGGTPIFNPTIARVNVAYSMFKDAYFKQRTYQNTTNRYLETLSQLREDIDKVLCTLWNQIENAFSDLEPSLKIEKCKEFGIIYYLRKGEK